MIQEFVDRFMERKAAIRARLSAKHPGYEDILKAILAELKGASEYDDPDPKGVTCITLGSYQGDYLFIIKAQWRNACWYVKVGYGSCSGCDTVQSIQWNRSTGERTDVPNNKQLDEYMTLALHIIQGLKVLE